MKIYITDPLSDPRWDDLVARHPRASVFHRRGWLQALAQTHGYRPLVMTSAAPEGPLTDGMVLCRVSSWLTGTRLVSLPFSDHCEPLLNDPHIVPEFIAWLQTECVRQRWKYVELRPLLPSQNVGDGWQPSCSHFFHELDITPSLERVFCGLHKDSLQRRIRRAERAGLSYEEGCSEQLVDEFYRLLLVTRRRHKLLPQPRNWFRSLIECMGPDIRIRVARKHEVPIAAILSLRHRSCVVYKYGCSDEKFHNLGGMPYLFWKLIEESKTSGVERIDFGRSDLNNDGLIAFKDKFGSKRTLLTYYRYRNPEVAESAIAMDLHAVRRLFSILPDALLSAAGRILYKQMG